MKGFDQVPVDLLPPCPRCGEPIRSVFVAYGRRDLAEPCGHRLTEDEALAVMASADEMVSRRAVGGPVPPGEPSPGPTPAT